jgi:hypothetical protein
MLRPTAGRAREGNRTMSEFNIVPAEDFDEEVDPAEVDRVIEALVELITSTVSQEIRYILDEACSDLAELVDDEPEEGEVELRDAA